MRKKWDALPAALQRFVLILALSNALSVVLFLARVAAADSYRYWFLLWNLFLAWLPLIFAALLVAHLRRKSWRHWQNVLLTLLWFGFLPNSFYVLSDLVHLRSTGEVSILYDAVLFSSFVFNAFVSGYLSVFLVHRALLHRQLTRTYAHVIIGLIFLTCGFAIYLGRYMRWNSWDVLVNPAGILFDVSDNIINPLAHPQVFVTTVTFFALLSVAYAVMYQLALVIRAGSSK
jgi:uncharacterized membrane protein